MVSPQASPRETLSTRIVRELTAEIGAGAVRPGDKLASENELAARFGVSRAVVREVISRLKAAGLVAVRHGIGAFVVQGEATEPFGISAADLDTVGDVLQVLELRIAVESEAAYLAAHRRDAEDLAVLEAAIAAMGRAIAADETAIEADLSFHRGIAAASRNRHFGALFDTLGALLIPRGRFWATGPGGRKGYLERINTEHAAIHRAIEVGDAESARHAMRVHLLGSYRRITAMAPEAPAA